MGASFKQAQMLMNKNKPPAKKGASGIFQRHARSVMGRRYNYQPPKPKEKQATAIGTGTKSATSTLSSALAKKLFRP